MSEFPFNVYKVQQFHYTTEVRTPGQEYDCKNCGNKCGHSGHGTITRQPIDVYRIETYKVIAENDTQYFYEENDSGYSGNSSIYTVEKVDVFTDLGKAEVDLAIKKANDE